MLTEMKAKSELNFKRFKTKINNFIDGRDTNDFTGILIIEKFFQKYYFLVSPTFADYVSGYRPKKRRIIVLALRIFVWIVNIRFAILALIDKPWVWTPLGDTNYLLGKSNLMSLMFLSFGSLSATVGLVYYVFELNHELDVISYLHKIRNNSDEYQLNIEYKTKFCHKIKVMAKHFVKHSVEVPTFLSGVTFTAVAIIAYMDQTYEYSALILLVWNLLFILWIIHEFSISLSDFILLYTIGLYLKYQFNQTRDQVLKSLKTNNISLLKNAIERHNFHSQLIPKFNRYFKFNIFITYFCAALGLNLLLSLALNIKLNPLLRIVYYSNFFQISVAVYIFNYIAAAVSHSAHRLTPILYAFLATNKTSTKQKLEISALIEKLSGPKIGFYCLDFFPFTNFELYQYLAFVSYAFILVNNTFDFRY
jgi:hypothetical protein